jgi:hypothetical protein
VVKLLCLIGMTAWLTLGATAQSSPMSSLVVAPSGGIVSTGPQGGPFSPTFFQYRISASNHVVRYSIRLPSWLTASSSFGAADTNGVTITLTVNRAVRLPLGTHDCRIAFANVTNGRGSTTRTATLIVLGHAGRPAREGPYLLDDQGGYLLDDQGGKLLAK